MKDIIIYTDGACSGNPGPGGYAAILIYKNEEKEITGGELSTTNNKMEMTAVLKALESLKEPCNITLYSDSSYVVDSIEKGWVKSWKKNNWIKSNKEKAKNTDIWDNILKQLEIHKVKFIRVKGHSDDEYNNRCDKLAVTEWKKISI